MLPSDKKWVLLLDDHIMASNIKNQLNFSGFSLGGGSGEIKIDFKREVWGAKRLSLISGLFLPPEAWGSWSIGKEVSMVFLQPLPEEFTLILDARAFGPNIGKPITMQIGNSAQTFNLTSQFEKKSIKVKNLQRSNELKFIVPNPTTPKEIHMGDDDRKLGIAFKELEISW
jgi:phosphoglycerol transferase